MTQGGCCRILIVYDSQSNNAAPVATDVLTNDTVDGLMNLNNGERFKVLLDKEFQISVSGNENFPWKKFKKLNLPVTYSGTGATAGDIQTGGVYMLTSNGGFVGGTGPLGSLRVRIRFADS